MKVYFIYIYRVCLSNESISIYSDIKDWSKI